MKRETEWREIDIQGVRKRQTYRDRDHLFSIQSTISISQCRYRMKRETEWREIDIQRVRQKQTYRDRTHLFSINQLFL